MNNVKKGSQTCLHRALREFGTDAFDFEVVERVPKERLLVREKFWITFFNAASLNGFNTRKNPVAVYDKVCSEVTRQRRSLSMKGRKKSPEHLKNLSDSLRGNKLSLETRERIRQANLGKKHTDATRAKISSSHRGKVKTNKHQAALTASLSGRIVGPPTAEHKAKLSAALKGRKKSPEHVVAAAAGRRASIEARRLAGIPPRRQSPDHIAKRMESLKITCATTRELKRLNKLQQI